MTICGVAACSMAEPRIVVLNWGTDGEELAWWLVVIAACTNYIAIDQLIMVIFVVDFQRLAAPVNVN